METWRLSGAADAKRWSFAGPKAANLLPHDAGEDDVDLYGGIAALGLANDHLFVPFATQRRPNFSNQTTTFLEKKTDFCVPTLVALVLTIFQRIANDPSQALEASTGTFSGNVVPGCDRPIFCVQLLDILSSYLALWRCRIVRFLLDLSQKSGCSCVLRLQFLRCRALSSEDLLHTRELQDLPARLREKRRWKVEFRVNFSEIFFSKSSIFLKKSPNSTSNPTSKSPVFLQIWTKITGHEKSVCHTLGNEMRNACLCFSFSPLAK